ncbi:MAG: DUF5317 family protein [Candidatus Limnocylindrales bacterium]
MLLLYAIAAGLLAGSVAGGRIAALADLHIRWLGVAVVGLVFQLVLFHPLVAERVGDLGPVLYVASTVLVFAALLRNLSLPGLPIVALGAALNLLAILANGGAMPSDPGAWLTLTGVAAIPTDDFTNSALMGPGTALPWLGDVFVLPRPIPLANVFSVGDVLIAMGIAWCVARSMRQPDAAAWRRATVAAPAAR